MIDFCKNSLAYNPNLIQKFVLQHLHQCMEELHLTLIIQIVTSLLMFRDTFPRMKESKTTSSKDVQPLLVNFSITGVLDGASFPLHGGLFC